MTARPQSQCTPTCARWRPPLADTAAADGEMGPIACDAFPEGIPAAIWENRADHRRPFPGDNGLRWAPAAEGVTFPAYALNVDAVPAGSMVAAGNASITGAMVALVPTADVAARMAVPGGESVEQLHSTMLFLGDAELIGENDRAALLDWAGKMAAGWDSVEADAFGLAAFNPNGTDPCLVAVLSGADVAEFQQTTLADVTDFMAIPEQHEPWIGHITLLYAEVSGLAAEMPRSLAEATQFGPVTFDRLRVAFAGEVHDFPFGGDDQPEVDSITQGELTPELFPKTEVAGGAIYVREQFDGCLRCFAPAHSGPCNRAVQ